MKPCFKIENRKTDYTASYTGILIELSITDESGTENSDSFSLKISDIGNSINLPKKGERITASIGADGALYPDPAWSFIIDEINLSGPPDVIEITGKAAPFDNAQGQKAIQSQKSRSWDDVTIGALVQEIATDHGLTAAVSNDLAQVKISHLDQTDESDNNLLTRLARTYGAVYKPTCNRLVFTSGNDGKAISGKSMGVIAVARGPGMKFHAKFSKRAEFATVKASYHDPEWAQTIDVTAGMSEEGAAIQKSKVYRDSSLRPDKATAEAAAKSKLKSLKRGSQMVDLDLPGLYKVTAEQRVSLTGFRAEMCGEWVAKKVEFNLSKSSGLRTKLSLETPGDGSEGESARANLLGNSDGSTDAEDDPEEWPDDEESEV